MNTPRKPEKTCWDSFSLQNSFNQQLFIDHLLCSKLREGLMLDETKRFPQQFVGKYLDPVLLFTEGRDGLKPTSLKERRNKRYFPESKENECPHSNSVRVSVMWWAL